MSGPQRPAGMQVDLSDLPATIPIFPLPGALLLPRMRLPLNIFEPRYLAMVRDALAGPRLIGMIQPTDPGSVATAPEHNRPALYGAGCVGRITAFTETDDGRFLITLTGQCRFHVDQELSVTTPYRQVQADFARYRQDLAAASDDGIDRARLMPVLKDYLARNGLAADWSAIEQAPGETLVNTLSMICPFNPSEKQALLEAEDLGDRSRVLIALIEMALAMGAKPDAPLQ
ncbi:LON peptidase substrate-binding domain-containing protein [Zavarzinia sp. CC-PAN008]|uniref:LON peptidase substrate-binding domain-containing protein n=1 Tax=Zavarzinia sp. CC-PAN008 TaxID=3243332 RepID=UPI003F744DF0